MPVNSLILSLACSLMIASATDESSLAQRTKRPRHPAKSEQSNELAKLKAEVVRTAGEFKQSLEKLVSLQERDLQTAAAEVERKRELLAQGIVSKRELEDAERTLSNARAKVGETRREITGADHLIAEAQAAEQVARLGSGRPGGYVATSSLIRFNGTANWAIAEVSKVDAFFISQFRHALPLSAVGQTPVHDKLGFDHHNSVDVALSPDSVEGRALMSYLRTAGIPFLAFRTAVPGAATGAHIHIGYPSKRLTK